MRFYGAEYNNIERGENWTRRNRVQYCCTLLHKTSYWSSASVVIVLLHKALFYSIFETLWKLWNFLKIYHFEFFWNLMKFLKVWNFMKILNFKTKIEILRNFWNFEILFKIFKFFFVFLILSFLNFMKFSNILISKKQFLCNEKPYCTLMPRNFIHWFCTRVQYDFLLHRNLFLLINMSENGMSRVLLLANRKTLK
jgi:hypothetical protein